ncbi:nucleoside monophosphate kinase [Candidatus Saccharibacteria bacterium]|nr:nucleoside monophosphate kinase [Candidatus Saccharibacteria bacterium]
MNILFLGAPGSGKSTIGQRLAKEMGWEWISTGEILRQSTEDWVVERLKTEQLFDDEMVMGLAIPRVRAAENAIFDGFPRTLRQAEILKEEGLLPDMIIEVDVPLEEIHERLALRGREQDTPEIVDQRYMMYQDTRNEIMAYIAGHGVPVAVINGVGTQEEVYARAKAEVMKGGDK